MSKHSHKQSTVGKIIKNSMNDLKNAASKLVINDKKEKTVAEYLPKDVVSWLNSQQKALKIKYQGKKDL